MGLGGREKFSSGTYKNRDSQLPGHDQHLRLHNSVFSWNAERLQYLGRVVNAHSEPISASALKKALAQSGFRSSSGSSTPAGGARE